MARSPLQDTVEPGDSPVSYRSEAVLPALAAPANRGFVSAWTVGVLVVLVVASVVPPLFSLPPRDAWLLGLTGSMFLLLTTMGARSCERDPTAARWSALFAGQLLLAGLSIWLSKGLAVLMVMGTLSQAVLYLRPAIAAAMSAACLGLMAFAASQAETDPKLVAQYSVTMLAPASFVAGFSWMMRQQHQLRLEQARLSSALGVANEKLRAHAEQAGALAAERERVRISRDMHDSVGHSLTNVHIQLELASSLLEVDNQRARVAVTMAARSTRDALSEVRRTVTALRDQQLPPLAEGIETLLASTRSGGVAATMKVDGESRRLPAAAELVLFRVAQEALTNVQRHANASEVKVTLRFSTGRTNLTIADDGVGTSSNGPGFGLRAMRERLEDIGGKLDVTNGAKAGMVVEAEVPQ